MTHRQEIQVRTEIDPRDFASKGMDSISSLDFCDDELAQEDRTALNSLF
jgi:hypothetical protein